ncbi:type II toxin-antitoxin system RelE/ParE family toxin [Gluconobacter cerinus]|uniref:type II toxin-antitoxin system RelE/ParE family toxin n=1 Tax=Gluconobacter cerinus TaxID=38307 RepID=UPI001B8B9563|nr:type II toxin-antitoxin system RelE/ParE family toxin [Gluconobacter cerinus]
MSKLQTVVELPEFIKWAKALMSDPDRMALINMLAAMPDAGISLGGGLRKVRFSRKGGWKKGEYRTLYIFNGRQMPLFLLTVFAKNEKDNLTRSEQAAPVELSKTLVAKYGEPS